MESVQGNNQQDEFAVIPAVFSSFNEAENVVEQHCEKFFKEFLLSTTAEPKILSAIESTISGAQRQHVAEADTDGYEPTGRERADTITQTEGGSRTSVLTPDSEETKTPTPTPEDDPEDYLRFSDILKKFDELRNANYELIVIGNTNVGKSTFLNTVTKMKGFFNESNVRETSCIWRFKVVPHDKQPQGIFEVKVFTVKQRNIGTTGGQNILTNDDQKIQVGEAKYYNNANDVVEVIKKKMMLKEAEQLNPQDLTPQELEGRARLPSEFRGPSTEDYST